MGRARSRRRRGKTGGAGSGGSGKGKGTGGSRGRSSNNRGGQGSGGSGSGKGTGGSKGRSTANRNTKKNNNKVKVNKTNEANKQARVDRRNERLKKQFGLDYNDMKNMKINIDVGRGVEHRENQLRNFLGIPTGKSLINRALPGFVKNFRVNAEFGGKFRSPNKLRVNPSDSKWGGGVKEQLFDQGPQAIKAQQKLRRKLSISSTKTTKQFTTTTRKTCQ